MTFTEWIRRRRPKAVEPWLEEGCSYKGVSWQGTVPVDEVKKQIDARHYSVDEKDTPVRAINISGTRILDIDLNKGWEITDIVFDNDISANEIDYLIVRFEKKKRAGGRE